MPPRRGVQCDDGAEAIRRHAVKLKRLGLKTRNRLSFDGAAREKAIFLYNDGGIPRSSEEATDAYLEKLRIILKANN